MRIGVRPEVANGFRSYNGVELPSRTRACRSALPVSWLNRHNGEMDSSSTPQSGPREEICAGESWSRSTADWIGPHRTVIAVLRALSGPIKSGPNEGSRCSKPRRKI
jgi:hypothetical protein